MSSCSNIPFFGKKDEKKVETPQGKTITVDGMETVKGVNPPKAEEAAPAKKSPARKPSTRKKPIGFEMMKSFQNQIIKSFETMQSVFDQCGELLNGYVYDGKKKNAALSRSQLMVLTKEAKSLRNVIQESKMKLKPIYKSE